MGLSSDLISKFVKATRDDKKTKSEATVYGTVKEYNNDLYVQLDGSELLTPISTTADMKNGERVMVQIKNHTATVIGNISSPAARTDDVKNVNSEVIEVKKVVAQKVDTEVFEAAKARIDDLETENVTIKGRLTATEGDIKNLKADSLTVEDANIKYATIESLDAAAADIDELKTNKLDASVAKITYATIESLNSANATIDNLQTNKLDATSADIKYANIDFANINMTSVETLFSKSGIIKDLVVDDTKITGELVGVTIKGDLIEGNTIVADKLVVKGTNGLYYKLNTDGIKTEAEQTEYNSLNGSIITSKTITASKITVDDLVAFDATIGGFNITENSIYSGVKTSVDNTTNGIYFDKNGQMAVGNSNNFIKYYKDQNGNYLLDISAATIKLGSKNIENSINEAKSVAESAQDSIDNLSIGGRNYILNSSFKQGMDKWYVTNNTMEIIDDGYNGKAARVTISMAGYVTPRQTPNISFLPAGTILSGTVKVKTETGDFTNAVMRFASKISIPLISTKVINNEWSLYTYQTTLSSDTTLETANVFGFYCQEISETITAIIDDIKLEIGNTHTDWSPAPEDIQNEVKTVNTRLTSAELLISEHTETITSTVTTIDDLGKRMTVVEQTDEDFTIRLNNMNTDISTAQSTANTAKTNATTAQSTANAAKIDAAAAQSTADNAQNAIDNLTIGGRNYILNSGFDTDISKWNYSGDNTISYLSTGGYNGTGGLQMVVAVSSTVTPRQANTLKFKSGQTLTCSVKVKEVNGSWGIKSYCRWVNLFSIPYSYHRVLDNEWTLYVYQITLTEDLTTTSANSFGFMGTGVGTFIIDEIMLEVANKPSDWQRAPEDIKTDITNAGKTATNYLGFSSSGLVVGDMTASTLGKNVLIDSDSVDIRNGTSTLASFGANTIYLGKNSDTSVINLCNGSATMRVKDNTDFRIYTDKRLVMSAYSSMLLDCYRDSTHMTRIAIQSSDPDVSSVVGGVQFTIYQGNIENTVKMLGNDIELKVTDGTKTTYATMHESIYKVNTSGTIVLNSPSSVQIADSSNYSFGIRLGSTYTKSKSINCYWIDGEVHDLLSQSSNGQTCYLGAGDLGEVTNTNIRGKYVRLYAHEGGGVYLGYSGSTAITSDRNMKTDILDIDSKYIDFFDRLRPITYKYDCPGNKGHRDHIGFVAQEVEEALTASGLTTEQFAGLVIEQDVVLSPDYDSSLSDEENAENEIHYDTLYSLRYEEFISLLVKKVQNLQTQMYELERRLS